MRVPRAGRVMRLPLPLVVASAAAVPLLLYMLLLSSPPDEWIPQNKLQPRPLVQRLRGSGPLGGGAQV